MRIAAVEVVPYALPFREPYLTARGRLERRELILLRLRTEDGLLGLGEAVPMSLRGGASLAEVVAELEGLAASDAPSFAETAAGLSPPARCAVQTALHDLRERAAGADGQANGGSVSCNATLIAGAPAAVAEDALRWAADGYGTFKLKLGTGADVEQVQAVREAVGPLSRIRVDANGVWDVAVATRLLEELEPLGVELAEQPVASLKEMADVAAATSIPLAADESVESRADAERAVAVGACRFAGVKLSKVGGPAAALEVAAAIPSYLSSALDGPVGIAAAATVARALDREATAPGLAHGLATQRLFSSTIASVECDLRAGMLHLPPGPGLGVEIDEVALAAHRL